LCDYIDGVDAFLNFAFRDVREEDKNTLTIRCPCDKCQNVLLKTGLDVRFDLLRCGIYEKYTRWEFHGESVDQFNGDNSRKNNENTGGYDSDEINMLKDTCCVAGTSLEIENEKDVEEHIHEQPTGETAKLYDLLKEHQESLSLNDETMSKFHILWNYYTWKFSTIGVNNWGDSSSNSLLKLQCQAWEATLLDSYYEAKKLINDLGLECVKIDACTNDCILYWREYAQLNECRTCGFPIWKTIEKGPSRGKEVPCKVLHYFPLKSRLRRLYMSRKTVKDMRWHKDERVEDGVMRQLADLLPGSHSMRSIPNLGEMLAMLNFD